MPIKQRSFSRSVLIGILGLATAIVPLAPTRAAALGSSPKPTLPPGTTTSDPCNNNLAIQVASDGRFNEGAYPDPSTCSTGPSSFNLSFAWPGLPGTSFDTVRVDGSDFIYGSSGSVISPPTDINSTTNQSSWQVTPVIKDTQTLSIVTGPSTGKPDTALIQNDITNTDSVAHQVGLRVMIDTMLNNNDGAPFFIPGAGAVTTETDFTGPAVPQYWQAFYSLTSSSQFSSQGTLIGGGATTPDRFVVASWPRIYNTPFDYTVTPGLSVTSDSAVAVYWLPKTLAPGATLHLATLYGLSGFTQDLSPPLALSITAPASLSTNSSGYTPNPFTVSAFTQNVGTVTASAATLTLSLPAGLSLAPGQAATYQAGDLTPGATAQTSWQVIAAPQASAATLSFSVTASAANATPKTVGRGIAVPSAPPQGTLLGLGDSIAAGYGLGPAEGDPSQLNDNAYAYPAILAKQLNYTLYNYASSGACTEGWPQCQSPTSDPLTPVLQQITDAYNAGIRPDVITLTVGGDDLNFAYCLPAYFGSVLGQATACTHAQLEHYINQDFMTGLVDDLSLISQDFPGAKVFITQVYNPFPQPVTSYGQTCGLYSALVAGAVIEQILQANLVDKISLFNTFMGSLITNQFQREVVKDQRIVYQTLGGYLNQVNVIIGQQAAIYHDTVVPLNFSGHDMCAAAGGGQQWVFGLHIHVIGQDVLGHTVDFTYPGPVCQHPDPLVDPNPSLTGGPQIQTIDDIGAVGIEADDNCMPHPTTQGQQQIANAVLAAAHA
jgi:lysophospholipase L1-like esterase